MQSQGAEHKEKDTSGVMLSPNSPISIVVIPTLPLIRHWGF